MDKEYTFVMLKPDCIKRGLIGEVIGRIEKKGYRIKDAKMVTVDTSFLSKFYAHIKNRPFYGDVVKYMLSGAVLGMLVEGVDSVNGMRRLIGPTVIEDAHPGTIRGDFAASSSNSLIHASESSEDVKTECSIFFGDKLESHL